MNGRRRGRLGGVGGGEGTNAPLERWARADDLAPPFRSFSLWAAGHALTLVTAAKVALSTFLFRGGGGLAYKGACSCSCLWRFGEGRREAGGVAASERRMDRLRLGAIFTPFLRPRADLDTS